MAVSGGMGMRWNIQPTRRAPLPRDSTDSAQFPPGYFAIQSTSDLYQLAKKREIRENSIDCYRFMIYRQGMVARMGWSVYN